MVADILQHPDFETWFLAQQHTHGTPSGGLNHSARSPATAHCHCTCWQPTPNVTPAHGRQPITTIHQHTTPSTHQ
jgi:hypothetical protein